jgi:hypothetical protein
LTTDSNAVPRVFLLDGSGLVETRRRVFLADSALLAADELLLQDADQALQTGPFSVVDKKAVPPSGDKHDYMSQGSYWWSDPSRPDGLPYVHRDGEVNPESQQLDSARLGSMCSAVNALGLAYFFSDHELFAEHAALLLRCWFLDEATRMNPHLEYGQGIPGHCAGRGKGIIDTSPFSWLVDAVGLLGAAPVWNSEDQEQLEAWFADYFDWLLEGDHGRAAAGQLDHHGTWYDVQVCCLALFLGREEVAGQILAERVPQRIAVQIGADGRQARELARTCGLDCCTMNLMAFFDLATLSERMGMDLWHWQAPEGGSIERAFDWLVEHGVKQKKWAYQQITAFDRIKFLPLLRRGGNRFDRVDCEALVEELDEEVKITADRTNLLYAVLQD